MTGISNIVSVLIYFLVGMICLVMAMKSMFSKRYLPFHEEAADKNWDNIEKPLQNVILTILKISGLGFLIVFLILTIFPIINYFKPNLYIKYSVPIISFIFCFGLFIFNFRLFKQTKAKTPWKGSLIVMIIITISLIISVI